MPEVPVIEAPAAAPAESVESSHQENFGQESTESTGTQIETQDTGAVETEATEQTPQGGKFDASGLIKDPAKKEALKALDPSLPGFIRDAVFTRKQIEAAGGLPALLEDRKFIAENGGREFFTQAKEELQSWDELDKAFTEGRPDFPQRIAKADPEAFTKMMPFALQEFATVAPEHYQHIGSRIVINTAEANRWPALLQTLYGMTGDKPEAQTAIKQMWDSLEGLREMASKVPEKKIDPREQQLTQREQEFAQKQATILTKSVDADSIRHRDSVIAREIKPFGDWETMDADRKGAVAAWISQRIGSVLGKDKAFLDRRNQLIMAGDRDGLAKLESDKLSEMVPKLVPQAAKVFGVSKAAAKAAPKPPAAAPKAPAGVVMLKNAPSPSMVDRRKTTPEMVFQNQAVLTDGRKVQWA
jgi:hypothetical protein